jgi:hypothetical protein
MIRRRARWLTVLFGAGLVAACCVGLLLLVVGADYVLNLHALPRLLFSVAALGAAGYALWHWMIRSLVSRLTLNDIAGRIEQTFPEYEDRLRSTVDILSGKELPGSEVMKQRVVSEAIRLTQTLDLTRVFDTRPVTYTTSLGAGSLLLLGILLCTVQHDYLSIACRRLLAPLNSNPWPKQVIIDPVGVLPDCLPLGGRVDINMRLSRGQSTSREAVVYYQYGDEAGSHFGPVEQEYMTRGSDGTYHASVDARAPSGASAGVLKVWMESGDDKKELHLVRIVQRLAINRLEAVVTPPAYAKLPPVRENLSESPLLMVRGSGVLLTAAFNKALDTAHPVVVELLTPDAKPVFKWQPVDGNRVTAAVNATESFRFRLHATDTDGFTNTASEEYEFVVRPDQLPTVQIIEPQGKLDRTSDSVIPLQALAEDDFGIQSLTLAVDRLGDKMHWDIPLVQNSVAMSGTQWSSIDSTNQLQRCRANYSWDLSQLQNVQLRPGDVLEYCVLAKDNYALNGDSHPPVASGKLRIVILSQEELNTKMIDALSDAAEQAKALKQSQETTEHQTADLARQIGAKPEMDDADRATADRLAGQQSVIASQTKSLGGDVSQLLEQMRQNKSTNQELQTTAREVGDLLNSTSENAMKSAANALDSVRTPAGNSDRDQAIRDAQADQATAAEALQKAMDRIGNAGSLSHALDSVQKMLAAQMKLSSEMADFAKANMGKSREELSPQDRQKLDELAGQQKELAAQTNKTLKEMARDAKKLSKSDAIAAAAMNKAVDAARQQNVAGNQEKAAKAAGQNQQGQAQTAEKQAEQGMQSMLENLKEAQQQKQAELARKLADVQQQLAALVAEQAGHNLDNLNLQGKEVLNGIDAAVRAELFDHAQRDSSVPMAPIEIGMLISLQDQSEHNAREIAKTIQDLPDSAEPAGLLTDAADRMSRATISLHQGKLLDAYNPSQVEALAALLQTLKQIDAQKDLADKQNQEQKKASVREAYTALLARQNELIAGTTTVDSIPKQDDGSLPRSAMLQLSQLSFQQGRLADTAQQMDADLSTLGSIVYSFANRDIVKNMRQAKDQLARQETGPATQILQQQISAELEAMIRDLATKPKEDKSPKDKPSKSSSGGEMPTPPPSMPSEAEFRLVKDLQLAENKATLLLSQQKHADKNAFIALGERQGDLRHLLDELIQKASKGKARLRPDATASAPLPEEIIDPSGPSTTRPSDTGLSTSSRPLPDKDVNLIGDRMSRVRQRLSNDGDAGPITLQLQNHIIQNLDQMIELSRQKQPPPTPPSKPKPATQPKSDDKQKPSSGVQPENSQAKAMQTNPSKSQGNKPSGDSGNPAEHTGDLAKQGAGMWGTITPRQRDAVIESQSERVLDRYKNLVDDYYRTMSTEPETTER